MRDYELQETEFYRDPDDTKTFKRIEGRRQGVIWVPVEEKGSGQVSRSEYAQNRPRDSKGRFVAENPKWTDEDWHHYFRHDTMRFVPKKDKPWVLERRHDMFLAKDFLIWLVVVLFILARIF